MLGGSHAIVDVENVVRGLRTPLQSTGICKDSESGLTPIGSGFGPAATAHEVIQGCDLTNKIAVVTGG